MIQAVLLDLDDTLLWDAKSVQEAFEATCAIAAAQYGIDPKKLEAAVREQAVKLYSSYETFPFTQMIGTNPFEGLWAQFLEGKNSEFRKLRDLVPGYRKESWTRGLLAVGIDDPALGVRLAETFPVERRNRPIVYEETFEVLDALKQQYRLLLLTNGSPDLQKEKLNGVPRIKSYFEQVVISGDFGRGKPDPAFFQHAVSLLSLRPDEVIMVGDKLTTDILGANRAGIPSVWINRHETKRSDEIVPSYEISNLRELVNLLAELQCS